MDPVAEATAAPSAYHVLLVGCDQYAPPQQSLSGCVNDIDAVERLLFEPPGVGIDPNLIKVSRLAAPRLGAASTTRFAAVTAPPTKPNIVQRLRDLAGPDVRQQDRVLIYYSGHGGQTQRLGGPGWFECLVGIDDRPIYDDELAPLISAITERTQDVTIILDCCHSGGATREVYGEPPHGASRFAAHVLQDEPDEPPPPAAEGDLPARERSRLLQSVDPDYIVVAACHADEKAQEDALDGSTAYGFLSYALASTVATVSPERRDGLRWADIWPRLLEQVHRAAATTGRTIQHPWIIGRPERHIFGGPWTPQDAGFAVTELDDGRYRLECGTVVGVTVDAVLGVYGRTPDRFPPVGSREDDDARIGRLRVVGAERSTSVAEAVDPPPQPLPPGARTRLIEPGQSERLRVRLDRADPDPAPVLSESNVLRLVDGDVPEVSVDRRPDGWAISNDVNRDLASVRVLDPGSTASIELAHHQLRLGLEAYARYNTVVRLAASSSDAELDQSLGLRLLDCTDQALLRAADPKRPALPELPRNANGVHDVAARALYTIRLRNVYWATLYVTVFNCTALGVVQFLGDVPIKSDDVATLWRGGVQRDPFVAVPDDPARDTVDRIIGIATTRPGVSLRGLETHEPIQRVIDLARTREGRGSGIADAYRPELWTAVTVPLRIRVGDRL